MTEKASDRTSIRARWCLGIMVAGYLALAVVAGAPNSPLTVLLPSGVSPPGWATGLASVAGVAGIARPWLIVLAWVLLAAVVAAFALLLGEAWAERVRLPAVLAAAGTSLTIAIAAPLLLSRDIYTYAAYGRIQALYGANPYVVRLSSFPRDPFVAVASVQWLPVHSPYGPLFTLVSAGIARAWAGSPGTTILAFKALSGVAVAAATGVVALTAVRVRPGRASLAVALVGLNPVLVIHTVGGGHVDALLAAPLAAAMALAMTRSTRHTLTDVGITVLLTSACLVKSTMAPALILWVWWLAKTPRMGRARTAAKHLALIVAAVGASLIPFAAGWRTLVPLASLGGIEAWASPSQLVGRSLRTVVTPVAGAGAGAGVAGVVHLAFLLLFGLLFWRVGRRSAGRGPVALVGGWGSALLLLALAMPFLLPWYVAWFAPFLWLMADDVLVMAGAVASVVLALTRVPADPFHGYSTPGVMNGVHYGAASALLVVFVVVARRLARPVAPTVDQRATPTLALEHDVGPAATR